MLFYFISFYCVIPSLSSNRSCNISARHWTGFVQLWWILARPEAINWFYFGYLIWETFVGIWETFVSFLMKSSAQNSGFFSVKYWKLRSFPSRLHHFITMYPVYLALQGGEIPTILAKFPIFSPLVPGCQSVSAAVVSKQRTSHQTSCHTIELSVIEQLLTLTGRDSVRPVSQSSPENSMQESSQRTRDGLCWLSTAGAPDGDLTNELWEHDNQETLLVSAGQRPLPRDCSCRRPFPTKPFEDRIVSRGSAHH